MCLEHFPTDWAAVPSLGAHAASACVAVTPRSGSCALGPVPRSLSLWLLWFPSADPLSVSPSASTPGITLTTVVISLLLF